MSYYAIEARKDGQHNTITIVGECNSKGTTIDRLFEDRRLRDLSEEEMQKMTSDLLHSGSASHDTTTYFLEELTCAEARIKPSPSGFGEYYVDGQGDAWASEADLLCEMRNGDGTLLELGKDELPKGVKDIRGHIHYEPARIFAIIDSDGEFEGYTSIVLL
jgi:hypothetical protein